MSLRYFVIQYTVCVWGGGGYLVPCWFCMFAHWQRNDRSIILVVGLFESESDMTYSQVWWPILGIRALHLTHPKCTHTAVNTHTHTVNTHPKQWVAIYAAAPGEQLGVRGLAQGHLSHSIGGGESAVHSLPPPTIPAGPRLEHKPLESNTLTITPWPKQWDTE